MCANGVRCQKLMSCQQQFDRRRTSTDRTKINLQIIANPDGDAMNIRPTITYEISYQIILNLIEDILYVDR